MVDPSLSFSQSQGLEPLPQPLKLGELSKKARLKIQALLHKSMSMGAKYGSGISWFEGPWKSITQDIYVEFFEQPITNYKIGTSDWDSMIGSVVLNQPYNKVFDLILFILRHRSCPVHLANSVRKIFEEEQLAYRLSNAAPLQIIPVSTPEEAKTILQALEDASSSTFSGARTHLLSAAAEINNGNASGAIRESIHAVESVARMLDGKGKDLGSALAALEQKISMHGAFKKGLLALYGYASDEKGIRHALLDDPIKPDMHDALFMFGACAAFVSFLIGKARTAGLVQ